MKPVQLDTAFPAYGQWDPKKTLEEQGMTLVLAKTAFPNYYPKFIAAGGSDATFTKLTWATATAQETSYKYGACNFDFPSGVPILINAAVRWPYGEITGGGLFIEPKFHTMLQPAHDNWVGDPKNRNVLVSASVGDGMFNYQEGAFLDKVRFDGDKRSAFYDPSYESSGVLAFDHGEGSQINRLKADNFNSFGIWIERGTPFQMVNFSGFTSNRGAIAIAGGAGNKAELGTVSCDDNPTIVKMFPWGVREAGGKVVIHSVKCESSTVHEGTLGTFHKWKGQSVAELRGQFNFTIHDLSYASTHTKTAHLFYIDDRLTNGTPQASRLEVTGLGSGYAALLVDARRGTYYDAPPDYSAWHAVYTTVDGVLKVNDVLQVPKTFKTNAGPMGYVLPGQSFDFANALPQQGVTGPQTGGGVTPPPCTWVLGTSGAWSVCVNGSQSRTTPYVPSIAGCKPTTAQPADKVETQACSTGITLPPIGPIVNALPNFKKDISPAWTGVRSVTFTGLNPSSLASKFLLSGPTGDRIVIDVSGFLFVGDTKTTVQVEANKAQTVTVTLAVACTFDRFGDSKRDASFNNNAFVGSVTKVEAKQ